MGIQAAVVVKQVETGMMLNIQQGTRHPHLSRELSIIKHHPYQG